MLSLGSSRIVFRSLAAPVSPSLRRPLSLRSSLFSGSSSVSTPTRSLQSRRALSVVRNPCDAKLFEYTSGHWLFNDALRHEERRRVFDVNELCRLAAESVDRSPAEITNFEKLAEGGFNRTFLITMRDGFRMVARIPYPVTVPKSYAVASEVATMAFLRSSGLPVPEVYGYSPVSDNAAKTEYMFMQFVQGTKLSDVWPSPKHSDMISVLRQLVEFESKMMSLPFPAGGSLYYARDLEKLGGGPGIPLKDEPFCLSPEPLCLGPDVRLCLWYGRRSQLNVFRGPYETAEAALTVAAHKELAYLQRFGQPILPFQRGRREAYQYQKQPPSDHIENLKRYLLIAPSLVPSDPALRRFCIRHPDLQPNNIILESPDSWKIVGLLDWQHASVLPLFLLAGIPDRLQNDDDPMSPSRTPPPSLPEDLDDLNEAARSRAEQLYRRRLVHHYYVRHTEECNKVHHAALNEPLGVLRRRLFHCAGDMWEGETFDLKIALMAATQNWEQLTGGGGAPCPLAFDNEDIRETLALGHAQREADEVMEACQNLVGVGLEGWVSTEKYAKALELGQNLKRNALAAASSEKERADIMAHWFLDDMDEEMYM